jgi:hypothetical protein
MVFAEISACCFSIPQTETFFSVLGDARGSFSKRERNFFRAVGVSFPLRYIYSIDGG